MDRKDRNWVVLFLIVGAIGAGLFMRYYEQAFSIASLDLQVTRDEAVVKSSGYLAQLGYSVEEYTNAVLLDNHQSGQVFLERTLGLEEANRLAREWVSIWYWHVRWFRPSEKEEFHVGIDPGGRIVFFEREILDATEGASLTQPKAETVARQFLAGAQGVSLDAFELIERSTTQEIARTDHVFTFRKKDFTIGEDGHYRIEVGVLGDKVGRFREYLHVPEEFSRSRGEVRSNADLLTQVSSTIGLVFILVAGLILLRGYRSRVLLTRRVRWVAATVCAVTIVAGINAFPLTRMGYDTTGSYSSFIVMQIAGILIGAAAFGLLVWFLGVAGESFSRETLYGGRKSAFSGSPLSRLFSWSYFRSCTVAYGLAFGTLGYVTVFYMLGSRYFGVWSPADTFDYSNSFGTSLPWINPLLVGLGAATSEEFWFRLMLIPLLIKWFRRPWVAVLVQAVVWGFMHSNYPTEPIYTRGIEITVVGIVDGLVFLRFGILATVLSHYVYNAFLGVLPMLMSNDLYFQLSGVFVVGALLVPALIFLVGLALGKVSAEATEEEELPEDSGDELPDASFAPLPPEPPPSSTGKSLDGYVLNGSTRRLLVAAGLAGAVLWIGFGEPRFGERSFKMKITRTAAVDMSRQFLESTGRSLEGYRHTVRFQESLGQDDFAFLLRNVGIPATDSLVSAHVPPWFWVVRWFRAMEPEEVSVNVGLDGRVTGFTHKLPESAAGDSLSESAARGIAEAFLLQEFDHDVRDSALYTRLEAEAVRRTSRQDYDFVWERIDQKVGEGKFELEANVQGNRVDRVSHRFQAPEAFLREFHETSLRQVLPVLLILALAIATVIIVIRQTLQAAKAHGFQWMWPVRMAVVMGTVYLLGQAVNISGFYNGYDTSVQLSTFVGEAAIRMVMGLLFAAMGGVLVLSFCQTLYKGSLSGETSPADWIRVVLAPGRNYSVWRDAVLAILSVACVTRGLSETSLYISTRLFPEFLTPGGIAPDNLNSYIPFLDTAAGAVNGVIFAVLLGLAASVAWRKSIGSFRLRALIVLGSLVVVSGVALGETIGHGLYQSIAVLPGVLYLLWVIGAVMRFNLLAYAMAFWMFVFVPPGLQYLAMEPASHVANGVAMTLVGLLPIFITVAAYFRDRKPLRLECRARHAV